MVFRPSSSEPQQTQPQQQMLPAQPVYQCVQPPEPQQQVAQTAQVQQPVAMQHQMQQQHVATSTTTNDEIAELLVALLEEVGGLKQALLNDGVEEIESLLKSDAPAPAPASASAPAIQAKKEQPAPPPEQARTLDFSKCF